MATSYIKGNLIHLFYKDGESYKTLAYCQSNNMSFSTSTTDISSKDHGIYPDKEVSGSSWSMSGEYYFTKENANKILQMAKSTKVYQFAFAQVTDAAEGSDTYAATGLKDVTGATGAPEAWTIGSDTWVQYGKGIVTSAEVSAGVGETATLSLEITGTGALTDTEA